MQKKVLILDGHTRQVLPIAKALYKRGHHVTILCPSKTSLGYVTRWQHQRIIGPDAKVSPQDFTDFLFDLLIHQKYDLVIPLFDYSAEILSLNKEKLEKLTKVAVNDYETFIKARDKSQTMQVCMDNNIPCTRTYYSGVEDIPKDIKDAFIYPVVIKPVAAESARGFHCIHQPAKVNEVFKDVVSKFGKSLVQEYISHTDLQYKCEVYIASDNKVKAAVVFSKVRWYPVEGGSSTFNLTVYRPDIVDSCIKLLKIIGWKGYADVDLIQDPIDGIAKIMEINPRITGSVKIAFDSGVDFANMIVDDIFGKNIVPVSYEIGRGLRLLHTDLLWLLKSPDRFKSKPCWFNFFDGKSSDQIISFDDPLPCIYYTIDNLKKLFTGR